MSGLRSYIRGPSRWASLRPILCNFPVKSRGKSTFVLLVNSVSYFLPRLRSHHWHTRDVTRDGAAKEREREERKKKRMQMDNRCEIADSGPKFGNIYLGSYNPGGLTSAMHCSLKISLVTLKHLLALGKLNVGPSIYDVRETFYIF